MRSKPNANDADNVNAGNSAQESDDQDGSDLGGGIDIDDSYNPASDGDELEGEDLAEGADIEPEEGGSVLNSSGDKEETEEVEMSDHDFGQPNANEENRVDTENQNNHETTQRQEFEAATGEKPEIPSAEWWNTLRAPRGATPRKTPSTRAIKIKDRAEPQEAKSPAWWRKFSSPLKSTATDAGRAREREATGTPEKVVDKNRQNELKAAFQKDWNRKQKKEQKYEAIFPVDLEKHAKNDSELQYLKGLQTQARKNYEPPRPRTHDTRQKRTATNADKPVLLINPKGARPKKRILSRGKVVNGVYRLGADLQFCCQICRCPLIRGLSPRSK